MGHWVNTRREFADAGDFLVLANSPLPMHSSRRSRLASFTYEVDLEGEALEYQQALLNTRSMKAWTQEALTETEFCTDGRTIRGRD